MPPSTLRRIYDEIGLQAVVNSPRDTKILCLQRIVRFVAYGSSSLVLALFLSVLHINEQRIGLFMTLTLLGDVVISLILTIIADGIGRRRMLMFGASMMVVSGIVFAICDNYWILVAASVFGVISPSGNEIGPFRAIEESTLVHLSAPEERTSILAWYTFFGFTGASAGILAFGYVIRALQTRLQWQPVDSYRVVFWAYAACGFIKLLLCFMLTVKCEPDPPQTSATPDAVDSNQDETRPLLANGYVEVPKPPTTSGSQLAKILHSLLPPLSKNSAAVVTKLCLLFALDSFGSGLIPQSWQTYFFNQKFKPSEDKLGTIFFTTSILSAVSNIAAAPIARRIGLIKTMVLTHVPASVALALIPIPSSALVAVLLLFFRACTNSMDQAPRQAFLAAAVLPGERTAVMGAVNVVKTLAQSTSPVVTGALAERSLFWVAFVSAGSLKLLYDVLILALFLGYRTVEERAEEAYFPSIRLRFILLNFYANSFVSSLDVVHMSSPYGQILDTYDTMSESSNNASRLHRSKSTTSVKDRKKNPLPSEPLDPEISRVHALIAAHRAMDRCQSRSSTDIGRSDSNVSRRSTGTKSQNVRFSPATQLRRQRSALQSRAPHLSAAVRVPPDQPQDDPYLDTIVSDFGAGTENYGSEPSSYRRLRRARSMLTPRRRLFSNPSSPSHTPFSQAPTLRTATSSTALAHPGLGLRIKRSLTFLRPVSRVSMPQEPDTHLGHNGEALRLARTQFLKNVEEKRAQKKTSLLALPKIRKPQKAFRKSVRSNQLRETIESVASDPASLNTTHAALSKRSFSASLRDRVLKAFGKSVTNQSALPPQRLEATRPHFGDIDDNGTSHFDNYHVDLDDRRESFYVPSRTGEDLDEERDRFSPTLHTAGSHDSLHSNSRSRVTSWSNSSATSSTIRGPGLERNRLSIIKEDGGPHQPSCSAGRHIGGISVFQDALETEDDEGNPYPPVDSQRIYSALMKRIGEEEAEIERTQAALEEIHGSSCGRPNAVNGGASTIRAVSATTVGTETAARDQIYNQDIGSGLSQHHSTLTPAIHKQNVERRKAKLASQEEQSSFFPFSDQGTQPQTPSPFRKLLEQRRSNSLSGDGDDRVLVDKTNLTSRDPLQKPLRGQFGQSSESIYSQTTNGGENLSYVAPIKSTEEPQPTDEQIDEDTGMATIIPPRSRTVERPRLQTADSSERREWKGWAEGELDASLGRRDYSKSGIHYREHAQIDPEDVKLSKDGRTRLGSKARATSRFPLLDLKEVPRNNTPVPKRSSSLTKSQSGLLKRASTFGLQSLSERNDENKKFGTNMRKLSPANLANMLKERKSQLLASKHQDAVKENKLSEATDSPHSSSPPMSTPGRFGLQMRGGNGRLRKRASEIAVRSKQKQHLTPKHVSTPLHSEVDQDSESPTDRVKQSLSARLSRPFNMDVPEPNRPFDSMFLGKHDVSLNDDRLSTAPNAANKRLRYYGGLGPSPFDGEDTALPEIKGSDDATKPAGGRGSGQERAGWSSKRMVSDFLRKRRIGRSMSTDEKEGRVSADEGMSPAFM